MIYLAGAISCYYPNEMEKAVNWRKEATELLYPIPVYNPAINFEKNFELTNETIVKANLVWLEKAKLILVNLEDVEKSPGTIFELTYAYLNHKPVIAFGTPYPSKPHILVSISQWCENVYQAVGIIKDIFYKPVTISIF